MDSKTILKRIKSLGNPKNVAGMARFGINPNNTYGVPVPALRSMAKEIGVDHTLALELWSSGVHEARILAGMIDDPKKVTEKQMEAWVRDFDSWDACDQCCMNLFWQTPFAFAKVAEFSRRKEEFVKRTAFALMAVLAWKDKTAKDSEIEKFLPAVKREADDERNFVKKAVNWALRQIGKRSILLNKKAIETAKQIQKIDSKSARWVAADALRELESPVVQKRLKAK